MAEELCVMCVYKPVRVWYNTLLSEEDTDA